jgi:hypothetical protein
MTDPIEPVVRTTIVVATVERAFQLFTAEIGTWWPLARHAVGSADQIAAVIFDCGAGGGVRERWHDGTEHPWAEVLAWDPPHSVTLAWHPGTPAETATEVELTFEAVGDAICRVTLVHRGWERLGEAGRQARGRYEAGWPGVLARFGAAATPVAVLEALARQTNQACWALLGQDPEVAADELVHLAHTSAWCWSRAGGPLEAARADWLLSHCYAVLGRPVEAGRYAAASLARCEAEGFGDFDLAYAYEAMARSAAAAGEPDSAGRWQAAALGQAGAVADPDDRALVLSDLAAGPWFGVDPPQPPQP